MHIKKFRVLHFAYQIRNNTLRILKKADMQKYEITKEKCIMSSKLSQIRVVKFI